MKKPNKNDLLTYPSVQALADELGLGVALTYRHLSNGEIPGIRLGGRWVISREGIRRWLAEARGTFPARVA